MLTRSAALAAAALLAAGPAQGQALRRPSTKAFPFSVTPFFAIGWGGQRATEDSPSCTRPDCIQHKVGIGPQVGLDLQIPLAGSLGFGVTAVGGRPTQVRCDIQCVSPQRLTAVHGAALILWRFKARAPIYFGIGAAGSYLDPGAVTGQPSVTEFGGALVAGYDFALGPTVGGRLGWWNYFVRPSDKGADGGTLPETYTVGNIVWDTQVGLGFRIAIGGR
jgi:hypothetical protein